MQYLMLLIVLTAPVTCDDLAARMPIADANTLCEVADEYGLCSNARRLLYVIYLVEGSREDRDKGLLDGHEMGVLLPAAQRYKGDHAKSLRLQAQYAAGTIKKRYRNDLPAFAKRWCPTNDPRDKQGLNKNWLRNARYYMTGDKQCQGK